MTEYLSQQVQKDYYELFREHLTQWDWQWHASLTFLPDNTFRSARKQFNRWRLDIIDEERRQLGIFYIASHKREHTHLHALMIGRNRHDRSLLHCSAQRRQAAWKHTAKIEEVENNEGISNYVALHFLGFKSDWAEYDFHGRSLLQQEMIPHIDGDCNVDLL
jgi:hypothetical protein